MHKIEGYYRFPAICGENAVFVSEDDLWTVNASGGTARRLTSNLGECSYPALSPDGEWLAFSGKEEGNAEVYLMPARGGPARRLTFTGALCQVAGWTPDGKSVLYRSDSGQPFAKMLRIFSVSRDGGLPAPLPYGPANHISFGPGGAVALGRNTGDPARWKRYRGGTAGDIWVDASGKGRFSRLLKLKGNMTCPMWVGGRVYFISDHEGIGNIYSCRPDGKGLRRHTSNAEFYCRNAAGDGRRIVYHSNGDLFVLDPAAGRESKIEIEYFSPRVQRNRKFSDAAGYLESYDLSPDGARMALASRGRAFSFSDWEGPVIQHGKSDGVRYRLARWLHDGRRLAVISDETGRERLEIYDRERAEKIKALDGPDIGRVFEMKASPKRDMLALSNHRQELLVVDLKTAKATTADKSGFGSAYGYGGFGIQGFDWSPDGKWLAYGFAASERKTEIRLYELASGKSYPVTKPVLADVCPSFDPGGKYLYFLSFREFNPVYDNMQFELSFPKGAKPCLLTLRNDLPSPFLERPKAPEKDKKEGAGKTKDLSFAVDPEGIQERVLAFPVPEGRYEQIWGIGDDKALFSGCPVEGALDVQWFSLEAPAKAVLEMYDLREQKKETIAQAATNFRVSMDSKTFAYRAGNRLRVLKAGEKPDEKLEKETGRKSGWLDLSRVKLSVNPPLEWEQMYKEAWRLQREQFWTPDMSGVAWEKVLARYRPLLERIASRSEFSDLVWEMQGELGTSHCYELMGDYRPEPRYSQGFLAADFEYDEAASSYRIRHIAKGDCWQEGADSPLNAPGVGAKAGDTLAGVGGRRLGRNTAPQELLVNCAGQEVQITLAGPDGKERNVVVKALSSETPVRYREWVEANRKHVLAATKGKAGYLHVPDMGPRGFSEFHRAYLTELEKPALIIDLRYNGGGHVSPLLLEKLARRRLGYDVSRWFPPSPYPPESLLGPMVALTNELAGSDGDIFSHSFKLMKLGALVGKRTWGGVIGIWPRHSLSDGTITTQPEFSFWFRDVGWKVENYGVEPDIEVEITPQDYAKGRDPQLERAVSETLKALAKKPAKIPDFRDRPDLSFPGKAAARPKRKAAGRMQLVS